MPLEDPNAIDIITTTPEGGVTLVITDAGLTADPPARRQALAAKLQTYVNYAVGEDFAAAYPEVTPAQVSIMVVCATPPDDAMAAITQVQPAGDPRRAIPVRFTRLARDGKDDVEADTCQDEEKACCGEEPPSPGRVALGRLLRRLVASCLLAAGVFLLYRSLTHNWAIPTMLLGLFLVFVGIGVMGTVRKG